MSFLNVRAIDCKMIWNAAPHNAFTDLIRYRGKWFCVFREGRRHAQCSGKIRVLVSDNGESWSSSALLAVRGVDLRDPKFALARGGLLSLYIGGTRMHNGKAIGRRPLFTQSRDGISWTRPEYIAEEGDWLWRVERSRGKYYSISYRLPAPRHWTVHFLTSANGRDWCDTACLRVTGLPNEATVRFRGTKAIALVRREADGGYAWIGTSAPPYQRWSWKQTQERVGGPNFIAVRDGSLVAATRLWREDSGRKEPCVAVCSMTQSSLTPELFLPSGGDCGYPGMVYHGGVLWIIYYSSHEGRSAIYLAQVRRDRTPSR